jgi:hypothetical protein
LTAAKLVTNPPEACGLVPSIIDRHYQDLVRGKPGELLAARCLLQPVGQKSRRTKDGWKTEVVYELVRLEPARDSHEADNIAWEISRDYENRTSGSSQEALPLVNSPAEQRESLLEALREWASEQDISRDDLDERWLSYYGGAEHAASATVQAGSLLQLMEFARYVGAVQDPKPGDDDQDDDGFGEDDEPAEHDDGSIPVPAFSGGGAS